jgi:hypothetical protein
MGEPMRHKGSINPCKVSSQTAELFASGSISLECTLSLVVMRGAGISGIVTYELNNTGIFSVP